MTGRLRLAGLYFAPVLLAALVFVRWGEDFQYSRLAWLALCMTAAWFTRPMRTRGGRSGWLLLAGSAFILVSWSFSGFSPVSLNSIAGWAAGLVAVYTLMQDERPLDYAAAMGLALAVASVYGILQAAGLVAAPLDAYGVRDAASFFGLSNFAAEVLVVAIPLTGWAAIRVSNSPLRWVLGVSAVLQTAYLVAAGSRAGWVGLAVVLGVLVLTWRPADKRLLAGVGAAGLLAIVAFGILNADRINLMSNDASLVFRREAWKSALEMGADNLLTGTGPGRFPAHVLEYASDDLLEVAPRYGRSVHHPHNEYLAAFSELGLLGFFWLCGAVLAGLWALRRGAPWSLAAFSGAATVAFVGFPLQQAAFWAVTAIAISAGLKREPELPQPPKAVRFSAGLGSLFLALFLAYLGSASAQARKGTAQLEAAAAVRRQAPEKARELTAQAASNLRRAIEMWPNFPESYVNLAAAAVTREQEIEALQKYLELMPGDHLAWLRLARVYRDAGRLSAAESTFERLLLQPRAPVDAYHGLAALYVDSGRFDAALRVTRKGLERYPASVQLLVDAGDAYRLSGRHDPASKFYVLALEKKDDEPLIYLRAGLNAMAANRYQEAEKYIQEGDRLSDVNPAFPLLLARLAYASDREDEAQEHLTEALKRDPGLANNLERDAPELAPLLDE